MGIGFWDRDLRFVRVNDALAKVNRTTPEEHVGRTLEEVIPTLAPTLLPLYRQVLESGEPLIHTESTDDDALVIGERRHWLSSYYPVRTPEGEVIGIGAVIMEITDRRRADDRLRLLAEAGELFSSSLDQDEIAARIAQVAVPRLADTCNVYRGLAPTSLVRVACVNNDPASCSRSRVAAIQVSARRRAAQDCSRRPFLDRVRCCSARSNRTYFDGARAPRRRPEAIRADRHPLADVRSDRRSRAVARHPDAGRAPGEPFRGADLDLAQELARRAAVAMDNARLVGELQRRAQAAQALEFVGDGVFLVDRDGVIRLWNPAAERITGLAERLIAGARASDVLGGVAARAGRRPQAVVLAGWARRRALALADRR